MSTSVFSYIDKENATGTRSQTPAFKQGSISRFPLKSHGHETASLKQGKLSGQRELSKKKVLVDVGNQITHHRSYRQSTAVDDEIKKTPLHATKPMSEENVEIWPEPEIVPPSSTNDDYEDIWPKSERLQDKDLFNLVNYWVKFRKPTHTEGPASPLKEVSPPCFLPSPASAHHIPVLELEEEEPMEMIPPPWE